MFADNKYKIYDLRIMIYDKFMKRKNILKSSIFNLKSLNGFTLIELIVSIGIISILAAAVLVTINPLDQFRKANDARRKTDLSQIQKALEQYYQDIGNYPKSSTSFQIENVSLTPVPWGGSWTPYMNALPSDPNSTDKYVYYTDNQQRYWLFTSLERGSKDSESCNSGSVCLSFTTTFTSILSPIPPTSNACGGICNFGVSSPNTVP